LRGIFWWNGRGIALFVPDSASITTTRSTRAARVSGYTGREDSTPAVSPGRKITEAEALRARRDMVYAQHQVGWALDRLCEMDGARWV
jgi:hypothetical protein